MQPVCARLLPFPRGTVVLLACGLAGCGLYVDAEEHASRIDGDLDGLPLADDCDDSDAQATTLRAWYEDADGDGVGAGTPVKSCSGPQGYVVVGGDCNDADPGLHALEVVHPDNDEDGFGDASLPTESCGLPLRYVADGRDCDDGDPEVNPGAPEVCNQVDDDCNGAIDADDAELQVPTWFLDEDGDGFGTQPFDGNPEGCTQPDSRGWSLLPGDCDDSDNEIYPAAEEICDGVDNDCDDEVDAADGDVSAPTWYLDDDGDGYGDPSRPSVACEIPPRHVDNDDDCDDSTFVVQPRPYEPELVGIFVLGCDDGLDNDCDGAIDKDDSDCLDGDGDGLIEGVDPVFHHDADGDGLHEMLCGRAAILMRGFWSDHGLYDALMSTSEVLDFEERILLGAVVPGAWCVDFGWRPHDHYEFRYVSTRSADGISIEADPHDCETWVLGDLDPYCGLLELEPLCGLSALSSCDNLYVDPDWTISVEWDGDL
jgi:hypothetical protein